MRALVASIIVLQLVVGAGLARADVTETAAQVHLDRGIAAFRAGDYAVAVHELTEASELMPAKPNPYRWRALAEAQLGDCEHALLDIESFLSRVPPEDARVPELVRLRGLCQHPRVPAVTSDPTPPAVVEKRAEPPPEHHTPITHRWWFWTALGAVALTTAGAIVYATRPDDPTVLPPVTCGATGCTP